MNFLPEFYQINLVYTILVYIIAINYRESRPRPNNLRTRGWKGYDKFFEKRV
jgi:hypothetical protein